jgi:CHAT domain-containing protein/tetratricopeptide (TPR) repeat protein
MLGTGLRARYTRSGQLVDLEVAIDSWQQAVRLTPPDSPDRASILINLGTGLSARYARGGNRSGQRGDAESDLEAAIASYQQAMQLTLSDSPDRASRLNNLSTSLHNRYTRGGPRNGQRGAESDLEAAIDSWQQAVQLTPPDSPDRASILNNLGTGLRDRYAQSGQLADLEAAIVSYRQAIVLGKDSALEVALMSSRSLGKILGDNARRTEALATYQDGLAVLDRLHKMQGLRAGKEAWLSEGQGLAARAAFVAARLGDPAAAIEHLERGSARLLAEALERRRVGLQALRGTAHEPALQRFQDAADQLARLERDGLTAPERAAGLTLAQAAKAAQDELDLAIADIQQVPGYRDYFLPPSFEQVRAASMGNTLVYLSVTAWGGQALIVQDGEAQHVLLDLNESDLDALLVRRDGDRVIGGYLPAQLGSGDIGAELDRVLPVLGEKVMGPVAEALSNGSRPTQGEQGTSVTLIPIGRLSLLPLHAARCAQDGASRAFTDDFIVSCAPSAVSLVAAHAQQQSRSSNTAQFLGIGNPTRDLRFAEAELRSIEAACLYPGAIPLFGQDATRDRFLQALPEATIAHLACHGRFDADDPLDSALQLAEGTRITARDIIHAGPTKARNLRLVVMSACQTAVIDANRVPDESIGLPGAFLQAGVPSVIGTLWSVNDLSTAILMVRFHEIYHATGQPAASLRQAQRWLRDQTKASLQAYLAEHPILQQYGADKAVREPDPPGGESAERIGRRYQPITAVDPLYAAPYYWAGFVAYGVDA